MQVAIIKFDDGTSQKITAVEFSKKTTEEITQQRRKLYCPDCNVQIAYRKPSSDGKIACFKQYSENIKHDNGCSYEVKKIITNDKKLIRVIEHTTKVFKTSNEPILLQLSGLEDAIKSVTIDKKSDDQIKKQDDSIIKIAHQKIYDRDPARIIQSTIKLNALLHYLIYTEDEANNSFVQVDYGSETINMPLDKLVCKFEDAINDHNYRLYWGKVKTCVGIIDKKTLYINTEDDLSLILNGEVMDKFIRHDTHHLVMPRDAFNEAYAIVYGKCYFGENGNRHINVDDLNLISTKIYKPKRSDDNQIFTVENATEKKTKGGHDYAHLKLKLKLFNMIWIDISWGANLGWHEDMRLFIDFLSAIELENAIEKGEVKPEHLIGKCGKVTLVKEYSKFHDEKYGRPYIYKPLRFSKLD